VLRPQLPDDEAPRSIERFREAGANSLVIGTKQAVAAIDRLLAANAESAEPARQLSARAQ
jgi:DNA repair photolyase